MITLSNCPVTGFAREAQVNSFKDNLASETIEIGFTIYVNNGANEVVPLRKNHSYVASNNQLVDPVDGAKYEGQNEGETYVGEYDYVVGKLLDMSVLLASEAVVEVLDSEGSL